MKTVKSKKVSASVVASVLVIAIALTGTFAWQSISQRVKNEADGFSLNSGGRLHDDFNGENKDIYVENYMDPADGSPIFARVRLHEYMEIGLNAGDLTGGDGTAEVIGKADAKIDDPSTWAVHTMGEDTASDDAAIHDYWKWKMGGSTVYMPTFNKNKDSLAADINGTYAGPDGDRTTPDKYEDYIEYTLDSEPKTDIAYYDADNNIVDEGNGTGSGNGGTEGTNYTAVEETHTVQETGESTVLSMAEWIAQGAPVGAYWVYDTDGWAYWAQAIQPGEATGLLLDGIELELEPVGKWYYAIDAVGQFASGGDWGDAADNSGFYEDGITEDGLLVLNQAAASITIATAGGANTVIVGQSLQLNATVTVIANKDVTWTVSGNQSTGTAIDTAGLLTVGDDEPVGTVLTVTAESKAITGLKTSKTITVRALGIEDFPGISITIATAGGVDTVAVGQTLQLSATVTMITNQDVTWTVSGNQSTGTAIDTAGLLTVGADEPVGTSLTVTAESKAIAGLKTSKTITVRALGIEDFPGISITITTAGGANTVKVGKKMQLSATVTMIANQDVIWTVSGNKSRNTVINTNGLLTVGADEEDGAALTVSAESKAIAGLKTSKTITVRELDIADIPAGSTTTIDGIEWYVLAKDNGKALLWAKNTVGADQTFSDSTNIWKDSTLRTYLNSTWLNTTTVLKDKVVQTDVTTRSQYNAADWITTQDKVFLLSEADLFGTFNNTATTDARDYTYGNKVLVPDINMRKFVGSGSNYAWLRSPYISTYSVAGVYSDGTLGYGNCSSTDGVRPALWVTYQ